MPTTFRGAIMTAPPPMCVESTGMSCMTACSSGSFQFELYLKICRERDLPALEWMGLFSTQRGIIRDTYTRQTRGEALMLLGMSNEYPVAQAWLDFVKRGSWQRP